VDQVVQVVAVDQDIIQELQTVILVLVTRADILQLRVMQEHLQPTHTTGHLVRVVEQAHNQLIILLLQAAQAHTVALLLLMVLVAVDQEEGLLRLIQVVVAQVVVMQLPTGVLAVPE
jgi:hypothetical protein